MHPYFAEQLISQKLRDMHETATRSRLAGHAQSVRVPRHRPITTFTARRRRTCAA